ncbi:MAG: hypothetical protein V7749_00390 [Cocleimonas sp.]
MFKKSVLSLALITTIAACGSSSDDSEKVETLPSVATSSTFTVIDGYLSNASVCVMLAAGGDCTAIGKTNAEGEIEIEAKYDGYTVVASVIAGETTDSDKAGFVGHSYEMRSAEGSSVVTPYTTLAALDDTKSLADIASELNLTPAVVAGDYIAENDAKAHLIARTLANRLDADYGKADSTALLETAKMASTYIDTDLANIDEDLSNVVINVGEGNKLTHKARIASIADFLEDADQTTPRYMASLNESWFKSEGISSVSFVDGNIYIEGRLLGSYTIEANTLVITGDGSDEFIYLSDEFALTVPNQGDMNVIAMADLATAKTDFTQKAVEGSSWYYVADDSGNGKIDIMSATFHFKTDTVTGFLDGKEIDYDYAIENGKIVIPSIDVEFKYITGNEEAVVIDDGFGKMALLVADNNLANRIVAKWAIAK